MGRLAENCTVLHSQLGKGTIVADLGETAVVRFEGKVEICDKKLLQVLAGPEELLARGELSEPLKTIAHFQALTIASVNQKWGVFSRSKIELLPHQMWVCRKAKSSVPCRLLVADDVGLGKTIEAGLVISSFMSAGKTQRLLILTPAALVRQWIDRMNVMFDIRPAEYSSAVDSEGSHFWDNMDCVVASYHTLRKDNKGRMKRFLSAAPWDLVVVDEAHHLNKDQKQGATLGYSLLETMLERELIKDMVFFTGTPHRGKDYGFFSLMHLLDDQFDPDGDKKSQLKRLGQFMIRNSKYNVTDMKGNKLFFEPDTRSYPYKYSTKEQIFYDLMTDFIQSGKAYADSLGIRRGQSVMLVLITMQKLASSSVAAIRSALRKRLKKIENNEIPDKNVLKKYDECSTEPEDTDRLAEVESSFVENSINFALKDDEIKDMRALLKVADSIEKETKIETILQVVQDEYSNENILFFTEYKETQKAMLEALIEEYGEESTAIINGDECLENVRFPDGKLHNVTMQRQHAAENFNKGKYRFLIATEAAGEGVDLQKNCHILFHVDLPWNPMRLHQRVGRLNRYGQKKKVIVRNFRNPDTVESRIWGKLLDKLKSITQVFGSVMEQREDLFHLVLGMTNMDMFVDVFANAPKKCKGSEETLTEWVDIRTATLGGKDVVDTVKELVGNAAKFNYNQLSHHLPAVDLPNLVPFFKNIFSYNHKRLLSNENGYYFQVPDAWKVFGVKDAYSNMVFNREDGNNQTLLGVGFKVFDKALEQGINMNAVICSVLGQENTVLIWSVHDQRTDHAGEKQKSFYGIILDKQLQILEILPDWKLLLFLNDVKVDRSAMPPVQFTIGEDVKEEIRKRIRAMLQEEDFKPALPVFILEGILLPEYREEKLFT